MVNKVMKNDNKVKKMMKVEIKNHLQKIEK